MLNLYRCMYINLNLHLLSCRLIQLVHWTVHFIGLLLHLCVVGSHLQNRMAAKTSRISKVPRSHPVCGAVASVSRLFVIKVVCFKCSDLLQRCFKWEVIKEGNFQINTLHPQNTSIYDSMNLRGFALVLWPCTSVFWKRPSQPSRSGDFERLLLLWTDPLLPSLVCFKPVGHQNSSHFDRKNGELANKEQTWM